MTPDGRPLFALAAEFDEPGRLKQAAANARAIGFRRMDAYSPLPIHGLGEALGARPRAVSAWVLAGGLSGCLGGFFMQWWSAVKDYPIDVGGRPLDSWPSFIPLCFELTILLGGLSALLAFFFLDDLPMPYHPVFNVDAFARASMDRFFLAIEASDPLFEESEVRRFLKGQGALEVHDVPE